MIRLSLASFLILAVGLLSCCVLLPVLAGPLPDSQLDSSNTDDTLEDCSATGASADLAAAVTESEDLDLESTTNDTLSDTHNDTLNDTLLSDEDVDTCPSCCERPSDVSVCETGTSLGRVDHVLALGVQSSGATAWSSCGLPRFPHAK